VGHGEAGMEEMECRARGRRQWSGVRGQLLPDGEGERGQSSGVRCQWLEGGSSAAVDALIEVVSNTNGYFHSVVRSAAAASLASRLKSEVSRQKSGVSREERIITRPIRCAVAFAPRITFCLLPSSFCLHFFRGMGGCGFSVTAVGWGESTHPPVLSPCVSAATAQRRRVCSWVALSSDEACQWGAE